MKITLLIITMLFFAAIIGGQENRMRQAERVVLDNPEVITLKLAPIVQLVSAGVRKPLSGPFEPGSKIKFEIVAHNTSLVPLQVRTWSHYTQNRPRLLRGNQEVSYREGLSKVLKQKDSEIEDIVSMSVITLEPNDEKLLEYLDLNDWYEPLQPGHYQLSTQHRFAQGGKWVESGSITFEVAPKESQPQH
jgi:hypothetical protein